MQVPTTETILDRQKEQKALMMEINRLKNERETIQANLAEYIEAKTALQNEIIGGVKVSDLKDTVLFNIREKYKMEAAVFSNAKQKFEQAAIQKRDELKKVKEQIEKSNKDLEKSESELIDLRIKLDEAKGINQKEISEIEKHKEKEINKLEKLKKDNEEALKKLREYESEYQGKKSELMKQEIRLANKGSDLAIYEARLRKKYLELMPDIEIVV